MHKDSVDLVFDEWDAEQGLWRLRLAYWRGWGHGLVTGAVVALLVTAGYLAWEMSRLPQ